MQSTEIIVNRGDKFFGVPIICDNNIFALKFDTGANETIISIEKINGSLSPKQRVIIKEYIKANGIEPRTFCTADGGTFEAYPACMRNVSVGQCNFEQFYYYLVVDELKSNKQIALLGDNFIDCCEFSHRVHSNIVITGFDFDSYHVDSNYLYTEEGLEIIQ